MQRLMDIFISCTALLALAPFLIIIVLLLRLTGEGEIFFIQNRVGLGGSIFRILKFATMIKNSPNMHNGTVTVKNDPRVLPLGKFLRKTKINEIPQLLNVLRGDMSLIGPRPQTRRCFEAFPISSKEAITKVVPGISGIGSIIFRNEEGMICATDKSDTLYDQVIMPYKGKLEEWYVSNNGLRLYSFLLAITLWVVIFPKSKIIWKIFPDLPKAPVEISKFLN